MICSICGNEIKEPTEEIKINVGLKIGDGSITICEACDECLYEHYSEIVRETQEYEPREPIQDESRD